ncbi:YfhO family protein [Streptococcus sp. 20-1249]|uniref:YfhO family protein n=1 Tax=Streptococcus hepaticus TaxID=3349163 RepID=UPI0037499E68
MHPKKKTLYYFIAFLLPFTTISIILATQGIWWGSDTTILASDGFHQYVIFNQTLRNTLHGQGSIFYTFTSGLGLNFYALSAYYLGSFLTPLVYFFDVSNMPDAMYLFTVLKFGLTGLSTYYSLIHIHKKLSPLFGLLLSTSLALMSFSTSQLEINSWLDVFILVPLILLGLHRLTARQGRILYYISLTCLFLQNYYFGYMTAIFLALYFILEISWDIKGKVTSIIDFTVVSILSTLTSMIMLLPTYLDLKTHGESLTKITNLQTENSWFLDFFAKNIVGNFGTTKFGAIPMISVGLIPLIFALLFFFLPHIKWTTKLAYLFVLSFIITSFYLQPLDLFWQGMHAPNMFLHRYAWVLSFMMIYMAAETCSHVKDIKLWHLLFTFLFLISGFLATYLFRENYSFLENAHFLLTTEFLLAYLILFLTLVSKKITIKFFSIATALFALFEIGLHSHYQVQGLAEEWNFPSRENYLRDVTDTDHIVNNIDNNYRTERLLPQTGNDSMKFNYNGISQFSSVRNRSSSTTLDKLGFRSDGTNLNLRYQNNTLIADSLFGIKYNISSIDPNKFGFSHKTSEESLKLYQNYYAQGIGILTTDIYKDVKFTNLTLDNQTHFLNALTGLNQTYFTSFEPNSSTQTTLFENRVSLQAVEKNDTASVQYNITVPKNGQVYVSLPNIRYSNENSKNIVITVNKLSSEFTVDNAFSFFNVGYFKAEENHTITISFPKNQTISYDQPQFYVLGQTAYQKAMVTLAEKDIHTSLRGNTIKTTYSTATEASILYTIPYDKGWTAKQNGQKLAISRAQNGFMKVNVKPGNGVITLTFIPNGFYVGCICFISGLLLFSLYEFMRKKYLVKKKNL